MGRPAYQADEALPPWARDLVQAFDDPGVIDVTASPDTLRRARRMARAIDADPELPRSKVALFIEAFDRLHAEKIEHVRAMASDPLMQRLRARAAGLRVGLASRAPA